MYHFLTLLMIGAGLALYKVSPLLTLLAVAASIPIAKRATTIDADAFWGWGMLAAIVVGVFLLLA